MPHRSTSKKRKQDDGSALEVGTDQNGAKQLKPKPKNRSPPQCGTGASGGKLAANYEMYVSRTHPDTSEDDIRGLVKENTATDSSGGVELVDVEVIAELKDQRGKVISKGWRVTFPYPDKETMEKKSAWPPGWNFRQYFPPRKQKQPIELLKPGVKIA